jgi:hypothetical protein
MGRYGILILVTLAVVIGLFMSSSPEHAARMSEASRNVAFTGETREMVIMLLALGIGAFVVYLTMTRR